jgi:hypothetical protein
MTNKMLKKYGYLPWAAIVISIAFGAALMMTSCKPQGTNLTFATETDLTFETIEQRELGGSYEARQPGLIVISSFQDLANLDGLVTDEAMAKLQELDYAAYFALVVFQGWKPTTEYSVQIDRVARTGKTINVYAQFHEPRPDELKGDLVTSPYHLVQVQKIGEWDQEFSFQVIVNETTVASLSHFIP